MIELHTLGRLDLRRDGRELYRVLAQPKRAALLIYLAVASPRGFRSRDVLLSLLWPESNQKRSRASLRKALHFLRTHLGPDAFVARGDELALERDRVWCDVAAFDDALGSEDERSALDLYRGELLPGFYASDAPDFERWLDGERRRLRRDAVQVAWRLSQREEDAGNGARAARFGRRALAVDPLDEMSVRRLMELLDRLGDRAGALRVYERATDHLRRELDLEPCEETRRLGDRLRGGVGLSSPGSAANTPATPKPPPVLDAAPSAPPPLPGESGGGGYGERVARSGNPSHRPRFTWKKALLMGMGVFALLGVAASGGLLFGVGSGTEEQPLGGISVERSVAVLPFENLGPDPEDRYFSEGVADEILSALTRVPGLKVAARTSSFAFRGADLDVRVIADSLGVATVLEGSVRRAADQVRVSATLVEADTGFQIWSETFEGELADMFSIQDQVARSVAEGLRLILADAAPTGPVTTSPTAYDHYLRGRQLAFQRTREGILGSIDAFEAAVDADPSYASAYAGLANAYTLARVYSFVPTDSSYLWAGREVTYADRALTLDPLNGEAHASRGWLTWNLAGPLDQAERHLVRGLELQPSLAPAFGWYGMLLSLQGRHEEALEAQEWAAELDPISPGVRIGYAASALWAGDPALTLTQIRRARQIQPGMGGLATAYEVWALLLLDRAEECLELELSALPAYEAACLYQAGRHLDAAARIERAIAGWSPSSSTLETNGLVIYHAWTGQLEEALGWVERGLAASAYVPTSSPVFMYPGGLWDTVLEEGGEDLRATIQRLRVEVWERVLEESRGVEQSLSPAP